MDAPKFIILRMDSYILYHWVSWIIVLHTRCNSKQIVTVYIKTQTLSILILLVNTLGNV